MKYQSLFKAALVLFALNVSSQAFADLIEKDSLCPSGRSAPLIPMSATVDCTGPHGTCTTPDYTKASDTAAKRLKIQCLTKVVKDHSSASEKCNRKGEDCQVEAKVEGRCCLPSMPGTDK